MTNIVSFHTPESLADKFFNSTEMRHYCAASAKRMQAVMDDPNSSWRDKVAKMVKAMMVNDDDEAGRIHHLLERLGTNITVI